MDDETYVIADFKQLPGRSFYRSFKRFDVARRFKYQQLCKFPRKYMLWQAICSCGLKSPSYIARGTMTSKIYIEQCLQKRLLPFILKHDQKPLFWPDLAAIHYSKVTQEWYKSNDVLVVPRTANPPNCPHLRPIETYWSLIKQILRKSSKIAKNEASFRKYWLAASKKVPKSLVKDLMGRVTSKVRKFSRDQLEG